MCRLSLVIRILGALVVAGVLAAGCLPGDGADDADEPAAADDDSDVADSDVADDADDEEPDAEGDTLVVWDHYVRGVEREVVDELNAEFEEQHGITIQRDTRTLDDLNATLGLAMREPDGPDVASVNQGRGDMGALVAAGLLMDLTEFGQERGWFDTFSENLLNRNMFSPDGEEFGSGNLYGAAPQAEIVGWYYNREKLDELALEVPSTFDELEELLAAAAEAGETPITFGNLDEWPGIHTYGAIQHVLVDTDYLNDFVFARGNVGFDRPENVEAAEIAQRWVDAGYFTENLEGIGYDDSWAMFAAGEGVLMLTGSWISGELDQEQFGFFPTPALTAGEVPPHVGGQGVPLGVRADTEVPDLAREYVDWMVSERAAELWAEAGALPAPEPPAGTVPEGSLLGDIIAAWDQVRDAGAVGHYLDWATPEYYDAITAQLQRLFTLAVEPQQFVDELEAEYRSFVD